MSSASLPLETCSPRSARLAWALAALLVILGFWVYRTSYAGAFVYDDGLCLLEEGRAINSWIPGPGEKWTTGARRWFTHLTFVANYKLHGYHVWGYHLVNNVIHISAALVLFGLVRRTLLLPATRSRYEQSATWLAFGIALLWMVHPLQTESVTYIVQRLEALAGMFFLLTLYAVLRGANSRYAWAWYSLAVVTVSLGVGSKETMFLAPLAALAYDRIYLATSWRELWTKRWPLYAAFVPAATWSLFMLGRTFTNTQAKAMGFGFQEISPWEYLRSQPAVILNYLKLSFWPAQQCLDYGWPVEHEALRIYGFGALIVALVVASLALLWVRPRLGFVALMFFFILAPTSSFMPIRDLCYEHRMYLSLASLCILLVLAIDAFCRYAFTARIPRVAIPAMLIALAAVALGLRTTERNRIYHDPVDVWREVTMVNPEHARGTYNLGKTLAQRGHVGDRERYRLLLVTDPHGVDRIGKQNSRVVIAGDLAEAVTWFTRTLEIDPRDASAHFNLGGLYDQAGETEKAIAMYRGALRCDRGHLFAGVNLARLLARRDEWEPAEKLFLRAIKIAPQEPRTYSNYGQALADRGQHHAAVAQFEKALALAPQHVPSRFRLAKLKWELGDQRGAISMLRDLQRSRSNLPQVNLALARYLALTSQRELHQPVAALALARETLLALQAPTVEAWETLAICQAELAQYDEAILSLDRALDLARANQDASKSEELECVRSSLQSYAAAQADL
jgi:tetratricopeptide (TPR) repeat protein